MGVRLLTMLHQAKQIFQPRSLRHNQRSSSSSSTSSNRPMSIDVPKGHFAVYVGETYKQYRFVVPISYLKQPLFQDLLRRTEEEYGFDHPTGSLTIPCSKDTFLDATSHLNCH